MFWCCGVVFGLVLYSIVKSLDWWVLLIYVLQLLINNLVEFLGLLVNVVVDMFCRFELLLGLVSVMVVCSLLLVIGGRYVCCCFLVLNRVSNLVMMVCLFIVLVRFIQLCVSFWVICIQYGIDIGDLLYCLLIVRLQMLMCFICLIYVFGQLLVCLILWMVGFMFWLMNVCMVVISIVLLLLSLLCIFCCFLY